MMSNNRNALPRLPHEVIAEIFRSKTLSCRDLFHCSLVSRQFVEKVNQSLYEHVRIEINTADSRHYEGPPELDPHVYTVGTLKLLMTLIAHERLAKYVKEMAFDRPWDEEKRGSERSVLRTNRPEALNTLLNLAPNVENVLLSEMWSANRPNLEAIREHKNVTGLSVIYLAEAEEQFCARLLPQIKCLRIVSMDISRKGRNATNTFSWNSLERLDVFGGVEIATSFPSLSASFSTIRALHLNLVFALDVDYSRLMVLRELSLESDASSSRSTSFETTYGEVQDFWTSLATSNSLQTLTFHHDETVPPEEPLFRKYRQGQAGPTDVIPTLRTIRFENDLQLDTVNGLLSSSLALFLDRIVVPLSFTQPNVDRLSLNKLRAVAFWCKAGRIELIFADQPRVSWTLLCTLVLPLYLLMCGRLTHRL